VRTIDKRYKCQTLPPCFLFFFPTQVNVFGTKNIACCSHSHRLASWCSVCVRQEFRRLQVPSTLCDKPLGARHGAARQTATRFVPKSPGQLSGHGDQDDQCFDSRQEQSIFLPPPPPPLHPDQRCGPPTLLWKGYQRILSRGQSGRR
jgi:hypothetical protein